MSTPAAPPEGRRNGAVEMIMSAPPVTIEPAANLAEAAERMISRGVGSLLVVDTGGQLIGILTDGDFTARRAGFPFSTFRAPQVLGEWLGDEGVERLYREVRRRRVSDVMSTRLCTVEAGEHVEQVLRLMLEHDIKHVPVVDDGRPIGIVARHDLLKLLLDCLPMKAASGEEER